MTDHSAHRALAFMESRGYLHRDVSSGNVHWIPDENDKDGGRGVLADVEYAKIYDSKSSESNVRTVGVSGLHK